MLGTSIALEIEGWMSPTELDWLANNARNCKSIIEVGCYKGRSTRALADNCPGIVYAVDPWNGPFYYDNGEIEYQVNDSIYHEFLRNISGCDNVIVTRDKFENTIKFLPPSDLIFIDADHRYEAVKKDILMAKNLLNINGILSGHDYGQGSWPGVKKAVDEIFGSNVKVIGTIWYVKF